MNNISDVGWTLAGVFGFALVCVIATIWLLSKRTIHVEQHNIQHNEPHVETAQAGVGGMAPTLIGWAFAALVAGIVVMAAVNLAQSAITSIDRALNPVVASPAATAIPAATAVPVRQIDPIEYPSMAPVLAGGGVNWLPVAVAVLCIAAATVWIYVSALLFLKAKRGAPLVDSTGQPVSPESEVRDDTKRTGIYTRDPDENVWQAALDNVPEEF